MILSQPSKYGLRAVLYLAKRDPELVQAKEIAEALDIPVSYLAKILQDLSKRSVLMSSKGRGGGFKLARPANEITLLDVIESIEGSSFVRGCVMGLGECPGEEPCPLHDQWSFIKAEILDMLVAENVMQLVEKASRPHRAS